MALALSLLADAFCKSASLCCASDTLRSQPPQTSAFVLCPQMSSCMARDALRPHMGLAHMGSKHVAKRQAVVVSAAKRDEVRP